MRLQYPVCVHHEVRRSSRHFIPAGGELVTKAGLEREVGAQLHSVLEIPRTEQAPPPQADVARAQLEILHRALQESSERGKSGLPDHAVGAAFIVLKPLEPHSGADLMDALGHLKTIGSRKEITTVRRARSRVGSGYGERRRAGASYRAADVDSTRPGSGDEVQIGRKGNDR